VPAGAAIAEEGASLVTEAEDAVVEEAEAAEGENTGGVEVGEGSTELVVVLDETRVGRAAGTPAKRSVCAPCMKP
jgi:hypothetical protein